MHCTAPYGKRTQGTNLAVSHCNIPTNITVTSQFCPTLPKPNAQLFCRGDPVMYLVQVLSHSLNLVCFQAPRGNLCPHHHFLETHTMWKVSNTFITHVVLTGGTRLRLLSYIGCRDRHTHHEEVSFQPKACTTTVERKEQTWCKHVGFLRAVPCDSFYFITKHCFSFSIWNKNKYFAILVQVMGNFRFCFSSHSNSALHS